jgi:hypothetical protein
MTHDDPFAQRLVELCERLPHLAPDAAQAQADAQWVHQQFRRHQGRLQERFADGSATDHERSALRCEIDAFDAACSVLDQLFQRRFGRALTGL